MGGSSSIRTGSSSSGSRTYSGNQMLKQGDQASELATGDAVKENLISRGLLGSGVCRDKVDLAFLVDASGNKDQKGHQHFKTSLAIVKSISSMFVINQLHTHIGFVVFSTNSQVVLNFKTHFDLKSVENAIDGIRYTGGSTNIGAGLRIVKSKLFDLTSRRNVPHILIVLTSGKSTEDVLVPSKALRDSGVTVFCIGIGNMYNVKELDGMATDPDAVTCF
ncbi:hypothetical protein OS493_015962 [Desmophyllum pertusum]|uniref:VWFA domain-containing protein n=1 Tax=Desmophyllum pertusum TaxID=174260 RepID=A0A9W9YCR7_9CNID|nr:hypothetical protein OS493_015962 [Desmophyllum pertusum]